jgi:hypothetical protein
MSESLSSGMLPVVEATEAGATVEPVGIAAPSNRSEMADASGHGA